MNMETYIFIAAMFFAFVILLAFLAIVRRFREKIKAKLYDIADKMIFNNMIRSFNVSFVKLTLSYCIAY